MLAAMEGVCADAKSAPGDERTDDVAATSAVDATGLVRIATSQRARPLELRLALIRRIVSVEKRVVESLTGKDCA
jgi:hypothetical protein